MKITLIPVGTRGDVQPAIALGKGLKQNGHQVCIATGANYREWIEQHGLEASPSRVDSRVIMESELGREWVDRGDSAWVWTLLLKKLYNQPAMAATMEDAWEACRDSQVILSSFLSDAFAAAIAEKTGALQIRYSLQPALRPTRYAAAIMTAPLPNRDGLFNYVYGKLFIEPYTWLVCGEATNRFRKEVLGLRPQTQKQNTAVLRQALGLNGYSAYVVPHPADWPPTVHTTGYWFLDNGQTWQPPRELLAFLEKGEPPVYIGFGSQTGRDAEGLTRVILEAIAQSGCRAVLLSGWGGLGQVELPPSIFTLKSAPHAWLFPRMAAIVHHGGAGTTAESLRAGVPTVVVAHIAEQHFWGRRVQALGAGPEPLWRQRSTAPQLAAAIRVATLDLRMKQCAAELGERIRSEDGVGTAVELIERHLAGIS